jgi:hypothetical protein
VREDVFYVVQADASRILAQPALNCDEPIQPGGNKVEAVFYPNLDGIQPVAAVGGPRDGNVPETEFAGK